MARPHLSQIKTSIIFYTLLFVFSGIPALAQQDFSVVTSLVGISEPGASYGQAVSWCDIDNDGDLDLAFSYNHGGTFRLYRNDDNQFTNITSAAGLSGLSAPILVWAEVTGDEFSDLIADDRLYRNNQDGSFTDITNGSGLVGYIAATGDFDQDNNLDLVSFNGALTILWGDGAGARVDVWADDLHATRWVTAGEGESDFHSLEVEFGLGASSEADSVLITWSGGQETKFFGLAGDQIVSVEQESAPSPVRETPGANCSWFRGI